MRSDTSYKLVAVERRDGDDAPVTTTCRDQVKYQEPFKVPKTGLEHGAASVSSVSCAAAAAEGVNHFKWTSAPGAVAQSDLR